MLLNSTKFFKKNCDFLEISKNRKVLRGDFQELFLFFLCFMMYKTYSISIFLKKYVLYGVLLCVHAKIHQIHHNCIESGLTLKLLLF